MAREYAPIRLSIWADDDFRPLYGDSKLLYFVLLTHPSLTHCGVADWRPKRLAALIGPDWTPERVENAAEQLQSELYVLVDEDTEEVLVRSFIRHDGLMKQPNMAVAMHSAYMAVASSAMRGVIVHEVKRLAVDHPELKSWGATASKDILAEMVSRDGIDPSTYPLGNPSLKGSRNPSPKGSRKGGSEGSANPSGNPSPTPRPSPAPAASSHQPSAPTERVAATASTEQDVLDVEVDEPPRPETAQTLVSEWIDHCSGGRPPDRVIGHVSREVGSLLGQGFSYAEVRTALAEWHSRGIDASKIPAILHELRTAPDRRPRGRPSSIETRLARNRQVVEAFRAEERAR